MGVKNLWQLLSAAARAIDIKSLEGAVVAVDVSIWMIKILHGMAKSGSAQFGQVHLIGIMRRVIQLLSLGIKPVFVFDGPPPDIKKKTIQLRQQQRAQYNFNLKKLAERYLVKLIEKGQGVVEADDHLEDLELEQIDLLIHQVNDEEDSHVDQEELEIHEMKRFEICNLEYKLCQKHIPLTEEEFNSLEIQEKENLLQSISVELLKFESDDLNQLSKVCLDHQMQRFEYLQQMRNIRREAARQIELLRISKILEKEDDESSRLLKEYIQNNEDMTMKLGQLGISNVFLYLKDESARKQLVEKIYGKKTNSKKRKLKEWQIENENLDAVREKVKKRFQIRQSQCLELEEDQPDEKINQNEELFDRFDVDNLDDLENILLNEIQIVQNSKQALPTEKQIEIENYSQMKVDDLLPIYTNEFKAEQIQKSFEFGTKQDQDNEEEDQNDEDLEEEEDEFSMEITQGKAFDNNKFVHISDYLNKLEEQPLNEKYKLQTKGFEGQTYDSIKSGERKDFQGLESKISETPEQLNKEEKQPSASFSQNKLFQHSRQSSNKNEFSQEQIDQVLENLEQEDVDEDEMLQVIQRYQNDFGSLQNKFEEVRYLLQLFGIPYIIAPGESEAQCAYLQKNNLVDCVVTEDSDVFLFGATKVLKGLFERDCRLNFYGIEQIEQELGLSQEKLIYLALFLGSDYTSGIKGVGIVNAMEIVECFDNEEALKRFQAWANRADLLLANVEGHYENIPEKERKFKELHRNYKKYWELPDNFPSREVITAYMVPKIDESLEPFSWGTPALPKIEEFCLQILEWSQEKTKGNVIEPLEKILGQQQQTKITNFFRPKLENKIAVINSRRIQDVVNNLTKPDQSREHISSSSKRKNLEKIYGKKKASGKKTAKINNADDGNDDLSRFEYQKQKK